ncbi:hypothetical protein BDA96_01G284900 [Sorghum bicolor]|uniref:Uncharacterized protein n=1 Tax=Sorghum bicolor TaxID=4558 RepID=A0A921V1L4_SORBI|nr:hypothetical protein BDA96_01G284900 [Sorghum bicolor]
MPRSDGLLRPPPTTPRLWQCSTGCRALAGSRRIIVNPGINRHPIGGFSNHTIWLQIYCCCVLLKLRCLFHTIYFLQLVLFCRFEVLYLVYINMLLINR